MVLNFKHTYGKHKHVYFSGYPHSGKHGGLAVAETQNHLLIIRPHVYCHNYQEFECVTVKRTQ